MPQLAAGVLGGVGEWQGSGVKVGKVHLGRGGVCRPHLRVLRVVRGGVKGVNMSVNKAIKLYRSKGLLNDNDLPAIEALFEAGYTIKWHGQGPYDTAWCTVVELERGAV